MTISYPANGTQVHIDGNGVTSTVAVEWTFWDQFDLEVIFTGVDEVDVVWAYAVAPGSWSYTGGNGGTGAVNFTATDLPTGTRLTVIPARRLNQPNDLNGGNINQSAIEAAVDRQAAHIQQLDETQRRMFRLPKSTLKGELYAAELPDGHYYKADASGNLVDGGAIATIAQDRFWKSDGAGNMVDGGSVGEIANAKAYAETAKLARDAAIAAAEQLPNAGPDYTPSENHAAIQSAVDSGRVIRLANQNSDPSVSTVYAFDKPIVLPNGGGLIGDGMRKSVQFQPQLTSSDGVEIIYAINTEFDEFHPYNDTTFYVSANYTAAAGDCIKARTTGGTFTVTLPTDPPQNTVVKIKKVSSDLNLLLIAGGGTNTVKGATDVALMHQNFLYLRFVESTGDWAIEIPLSIALKNFWMRSDYTDLVRGIKFEGTQFSLIENVYLDRFGFNSLWMDSVSDPRDGKVLKNTNHNDIPFCVSAETSKNNDSVGIYVGGTESHKATPVAFSRNFCGRSDNNTFGQVRAANSDYGFNLEAGTNNHFGALILNGNRLKGGLCKFYGNYIGQLRLEVNGDIGFHFADDGGLGFAGRNVIANAHNGGGQTQFIVDDTGRNEWYYHDSSRTAKHLPLSAGLVTEGLTAGQDGLMGRDANGLNFQEMNINVTGSFPKLTLKRQGGATSSARGTIEWGSSLASQSISAQVGFVGTSAMFEFNNLKTDGYFALNAPVRLAEKTVAQLTGALATAVGDGALAFCSNGDAGAPCLAVSLSGAWKRIALGADVAGA